jgi:hypothetical protein
MSFTDRASRESLYEINPTDSFAVLSASMVSCNSLARGVVTSGGEDGDAGKDDETSSLGTSWSEMSLCMLISYSCIL